METSHRTFPAALHDLAAMAVLLERLESQPRKASAEQYREVVQRVSQLLRQAEPGAALNALLAVAPATGEIYENLQYEHAGLCLAPLDRAMAAEHDAVTAIDHARRATPAV
ncbi:MAG TPA: hypothetical protein VLJ62_23160 [Burkholderiaceae bacterium]|nr:hypothetical protein [Burkholderiaceae bacterium]